MPSRGLPVTGAVYTIDRTGPTVTINQAIGQADPTSTSPINFTVVFNEAISNFATGDVTISGGAGGVKTATVSGGPTTYTVAVTGMTTSGTVIASIGAGVATDALGNTSSASTSTDNTVTWNQPTTATKLLFSQQPTTRQAGLSITPAITVRVADASNNTVTTATNAVTLAIGTNPGAGTLSGTLTVNAVNGVATFSNISINRVGTGYTLTAAATGLTGATSSTFNITPGPAATFQVSGFNNPTVAGVSHTFTVRALDGSGNTATGYTGTVHFTSSDAAATLPANTTFTAGNAGVRTFSATLRTAGSRSITATDTVTASITGTQSGITVNPAAVNHIGLTPSLVLDHGRRDRDLHRSPASMRSTTSSARSLRPRCRSARTGRATAPPARARRRWPVPIRSPPRTPRLARPPRPSWWWRRAASRLSWTQQPTNEARNTSIAPTPVVAVVDSFGNVVTTNSSDVHHPHPDHQSVRRDPVGHEGPDRLRRLGELHRLEHQPSWYRVPDHRNRVRPHQRGQQYLQHHVTTSAGVPPARPDPERPPD